MARYAVRLIHQKDLLTKEMLSLKCQPSVLRNRWLWAVVLVAFILRVVAALVWHRSASADNGFFRLGDSDGYWVLASHIARAEPYQYGSENAAIFRAPLMPLFLSGFTLIQDRSMAILSARIAGAALGALAVLLVAVLASRIVHATLELSSGLGKDTQPAARDLAASSAICAASLATCHPSAVGMSVIVLSEMVFVPLMLVYLILTTQWLPSLFVDQDQVSDRDKGSIVCEKRMMLLALLTGIVGGLATLARPSWLLFGPFSLVVGIFLMKQRLKYLKAMLIVGFGICLAMSPWWLRNYTVCGKFVLTTLQVGPSLYDSFHQGASGGSDEGMEFMRHIEAEQMAEDREMLAVTSDKPLESTFEWRINRRAQRQALDWCWQNPVQVVKLAWAKFCKTWNVWPDGGEVGSPLIRAAISLGTMVILALAVCATWKRSLASLPLLAICWSPCLYFTLLHLVFVGSVRYREPAIVVLAAVAGCALASIFSRINPSTEDCSRVSSTLPDRSTG